MTPKYLISRLFLAVGLTLALSGGVQAQILDDLTVRVERGGASSIWLDGRYRDIDFTWQRAAVTAGRGPFSLGLTYLRAENQGSSMVPLWLIRGEESWVIDVAYTRPLSWNTRLETTGNLVLSSDTFIDAPRLKSFSRVQANVVFYHPDGMGWLRGAPLFPSSYVGTIVNELGRVQGLVGAGTWWKGLGIYGVGFYSFNGIEDPWHPNDNPDSAIGFLQDAGVNLSASYTWRNLKLEVLRNIPLRRGAQDLNVTLQYRHFFR
ncbi:MAG: hypothetical protein AAGI71_13780 [Bacteroidota bacterium]